MSDPPNNPFESSKTFFRLLNLPRELRDYVYENALVTYEPIDVLNLTDAFAFHIPHQKLGLSPALLRSCHQICREALDVLYALNTFHGIVYLRLHHALRRVEVQRALKPLRLAADSDLPEPEVITWIDRPQFCHNCIPKIRRFALRLEQVVPNRPHWEDGGISLDHTMHDLCRTFVEQGRLDLLILSSAGQAHERHWVAAAGHNVNFARGLELTMRQYHEWHVERALLAARRQNGVVWIDSPDLFLEMNSEPTFGCSMRNVEPEKVARFTDTLPKRFQDAGQLKFRR